MGTKRVVITGGPGSGKTALIKYLEREGHCVMHEISRQVTLQAQQEGIAQLFLENPLLFSQKLFEGRLEQYHHGKISEADILFYDRGIADVTAYLDFLDVHYPENFSNDCFTHKYDLIFILPPWQDIYHPDNERYETFEQAERIFHHLKMGYEKYGYEVHEIPTGTVQERMLYLLDFLKKKM